MEIRFCSATYSESGYVEWELTAVTPEDGFNLSRMYHKDQRYSRLVSLSPPKVRIRIPHDSPAYGVRGESFSWGSIELNPPTEFKNEMDYRDTASRESD